MHVFRIGESQYEVAPVYRAGGLDLKIDGDVLEIDLHQLDEHRFTIRAGNVRTAGWVYSDGDRTFLHIRGRTFEIEALNALERARRMALADRGEAVTVAPMPGTVVEVHVAIGDEVAEGQLLLVIESMKLQTAITAEVGGVVTDLPLAVGDSFEVGALLVRVQNPNQEESS